MQPLILTAAFDETSRAVFHDLRNRHFPPSLNRVPAHLTLFHHLPGSELPSILDRLTTEASHLAPIPFVTAGVRFLGRGCAFDIAAPALLQLRAALAADWRGWLNPQDRQGFRPHVTVQNKVAPDAAQALAEDLATLPPMKGRIVGLDLWHYEGGPWRLEQHRPFAATSPSAEESAEPA